MIALVRCGGRLCRVALAAGFAAWVVSAPPCKADGGRRSRVPDLPQAAHGPPQTPRPGRRHAGLRQARPLPGLPGVRPGVPPRVRLRRRRPGRRGRRRLPLLRRPRLPPPLADPAAVRRGSRRSRSTAGRAAPRPPAPTTSGPWARSSPTGRSSRSSANPARPTTPAATAPSPGSCPIRRSVLAPFTTARRGRRVVERGQLGLPPNAPPNTAPAPGEVLDEHAASRSLGIDVGAVHRRRRRPRAEGHPGLSREPGAKGRAAGRRRDPVDQRLRHRVAGQPGVDHRERRARPRPQDDPAHRERRPGAHRHDPAPLIGDRNDSRSATRLRGSSGPGSMVVAILAHLDPSRPCLVDHERVLYTEPRERGCQGSPRRVDRSSEFGSNQLGTTTAWGAAASIRVRSQAIRRSVWSVPCSQTRIISSSRRAWAHWWSTSQVMCASLASSQRSWRSRSRPRPPVRRPRKRAEARWLGSSRSVGGVAGDQGLKGLGVLAGPVGEHVEDRRHVRLLARGARRPRAAPSPARARRRGRARGSRPRGRRWPRRRRSSTASLTTSAAWATPPATADAASPARVRSVTLPARTAAYLNVRLLADRVPVGERQLVGGPGRAVAAPVAVVEGDEQVAGDDVAHPRRGAERAAAGADLQQVAVGHAERPGVLLGDLHERLGGGVVQGLRRGRSWSGCGSGRRPGRWSARTGNRRRAPRPAGRSRPA